MAKEKDIKWIVGVICLLIAAVMYWGSGAIELINAVNSLLTSVRLTIFAIGGMMLVFAGARVVERQQPVGVFLALLGVGIIGIGITGSMLGLSYMTEPVKDLAQLFTDPTTMVGLLAAIFGATVLVTGKIPLLEED